MPVIANYLDTRDAAEERKTVDKLINKNGKRS